MAQIDTCGTRARSSDPQRILSRRKLLIQERNSFRFLVRRPANHEKDDLLRSLCRRRILRLLRWIQVRVAGISEPTLQEKFDCLSQMRRVLRIDVLHAFQTLHCALAAGEEVLVHEKIVLALVSSCKVEHDVHELEEN